MSAWLCLIPHRVTTVPSAPTPSIAATLVVRAEDEQQHVVPAGPAGNARGPAATNHWRRWLRTPPLLSGAAGTRDGLRRRSSPATPLARRDRALARWTPAPRCPVLPHASWAFAGRCHPDLAPAQDRRGPWWAAAREPRSRPSSGPHQVRPGQRCALRPVAPPARSGPSTSLLIVQATRRPARTKATHRPAPLPPSRDR